MDRKLTILMAVVDEYINTGEPVGSKAIAEIFGNTISSATIRNDMSTLCELGFLEQPHTSAGRVPTAKAYRIYVDGITTNRSAPARKKRIDETIKELAADSNPAKNAGKALSELVGFPTLSARERATDKIACVRVIPISEQVFTVITITESGRVANCPVRCRRRPSEAAIERFTQAASMTFSGMAAGDLNAAAIQTLGMREGEYLFELTGFTDALAETISTLGTAEINLAGEQNLFSLPDYDTVQLRELLNMLANHRILAELLKKPNTGIGVSIGSEIPLPQLFSSALLISQYGDPESPAKLGIIAPMRIDYKNMIAELQYFTHSVEKLLRDQENGGDTTDG